MEYFVPKCYNINVMKTKIIRYAFEGSYNNGNWYTWRQ